MCCESEIFFLRNLPVFPLNKKKSAFFHLKFGVKMTLLEESSWFSPKEIFKFILKSSQKLKSKDRNPSLIPSRICHENCSFQEEFSCFSPSGSISFPVKCPWPFPFPCRAESFPEGLADIFQLQRAGRESTWGWFQEPRAAASAGPAPEPQLC